MQPDEQTTRLTQARYLYETIHMLQRRVFRRHANSLGSRDGSSVCGELTMPQWHMMMAVRRFGSPSLKELAQALDVSAPSASAMVDRLVEMGMLTREPSQVDRREVVVALSEAGHAMAARMEEEILHSISEVLAQLGPEYSGKWCEVFEQIRQVLTEEDASHGRGTEHTYS